MPHMSKETVTPIELGPGIEWRGDLDGYVTSIVKVTGDTDLTPLLQGLPDDRCPSPHWGYAFAGADVVPLRRPHRELRARRGVLREPGPHRGGRRGDRVRHLQPRGDRGRGRGPHGPAVRRSCRTRHADRADQAEAGSSSGRSPCFIANRLAMARVEAPIFA